MHHPPLSPSFGAWYTGTMTTCTGKFTIKGNGARQVASLSRIDVRKFSQRGHFSFAVGDPPLHPRPQGGDPVSAVRASHAVGSGRENIIRASVIAPDEQAGRAFPRAECSGGSFGAVSGQRLSNPLTGTCSSGRRRCPSRRIC